MAKQAVDCRNMVVTIKGCVMAHPNHYLVTQKLQSNAVLTHYTRILLLVIKCV